MNEYHLEYILTYTATIKSPGEVIGPVPEGIRTIGYISGGEVSGPKIRGKVRPVGADWATIRPDGVGVPDVRLTMETDDGALIYVTYQGVMDFGEDGYQKRLQPGYRVEKFPPIRTTPRFQTSHPNYRWLNRLHCLGVGEFDTERREVRYDVYAVR